MKRTLTLLMALTLAIVIVGCGNGTNGENADGVPGEELDAATLIDRSCTGCHGEAQIYTNRDRDEWPEIVNKMAVNTVLSSEEIETITLYLQENYSN